jgi:hypothetical protein
MESKLSGNATQMLYKLLGKVLIFSFLHARVPKKLALPAAFFSGD